MHLELTSLLAITSLISASFNQEILHPSNAPPNFIQTSIFGRKEVVFDSTNDVLSLPPTSRRVGFEEDRNFEGIVTFAHLPYVECTTSSADKTFDIGIVGHPFDLGVSYRPGARFGPNGARRGARRLDAVAGYEYVIPYD